ncbi:MAG: hypothetical protein M1150_03265 [Patescibacteria group bacterium]|nr:hypothetical protein [Patescibacteria group bacterium]
MELPKELTTITATSKTLAAIVFVSLPFIAFFAGNYYQASVTLKSTDTNVVSTPKTSTSSANTVSTSSATADWRTYSNSTYGLSFKYPTTLVLGSSSSANNMLNLEFSSSDKKSNLFVYAATKSADFRYGHGVEGTKRVLEKNVTVGGYTGNLTQYKTDASLQGSDTSLYDSYFITFQDQLVAIEYFGLKDVVTQQQLDQILSTFKFTDQTQTDENTSSQNKISMTIPSDWKTYNKFFGDAYFKFKYPSRYGISDNDPSSGDIYVGKEGSLDTADINSNSKFFASTFTEYNTGSRRVWFKEVLGKYYTDVDLSNLIFDEIVFDNGKSYLKITNWPNEMFKGKAFYLGIQNGISFFVTNGKALSNEDLLRVLSTIEVTK